MVVTESSKQAAAAESSKQAAAASSSQAAAAAQQTQTAQSQRGDMNTAETGTIVGNVNSKIYHVPGQAGYRMNSANAVHFNTEQDAINAGYRKAVLVVHSVMQHRAILRGVAQQRAREARLRAAQQQEAA